MEKITKINKMKKIGVEFLKDVLFFGLVLVIGLVIVPEYIVAKTEVSGVSMESTLKNEDQVFIDKAAYRLGEPKRFDIIVFRHYFDKQNIDKTDKDAYEFYVKRIIGLPGETVQIKDDAIYINGERIVENFGKGDMGYDGIAEEPVVLGADEYFVLGDNREESKDSRDPLVGNVKKEWIEGKVWFRLYPFSSLGILE